MKSVSFFNLILFVCILFIFVPHAVSKDYTQFSLPKGAKLRIGKGNINGIYYSPDSMHLVVASSIGIWIYDTQTGKELNLITDHTSSITSAMYSPDGTMIVSTSRDGKVRLWNATTGNLKVKLITDIDKIYQDHIAVFSPDGNLIATGGSFSSKSQNRLIGAVRLWDAATSKLKATFTTQNLPVTTVVFSPDSTTLVSLSSQKKAMNLWHISSGKLIMTLGHTNKIHSLIYSPDSTTIATSHIDKNVRLWDTTTGKLKTTLPHTEQVTSVVYSPDGTTLATASVDHTVRLWDATTGKLKATLIRYTDWVTSLMYSPDGSTIASLSRDKTIRLWDADNGKLKTTLEHSNIVASFVYSPDGTTLVSRSYDETMRLWNTSTGKLITAFRHSNKIHSLMYSPDGRILASWSNKDNKIRLWDANSRKTRSYTFRTYRRCLLPCVFS